ARAAADVEHDAPDRSRLRQPHDLGLRSADLPRRLAVVGLLEDLGVHGIVLGLGYSGWRSERFRIILSRAARCLVGLEESNATNSGPMPRDPLPHLRARPRPFERMGIEAVILGPGSPHIFDEFGPTAPRPPLQVVVTEGAEQQLRLVEPRGVHRGKPTPPPV